KHRPDVGHSVLADHDHCGGPNEQGVAVRQCDGPGDHVDQRPICRVRVTTHDGSHRLATARPTRTRCAESLPCNWGHHLAIILSTGGRHAPTWEPDVATQT